jgi:hypothetical protein
MIRWRKLIKDAVQISLTKDMGTDYWGDPAELALNKYFNSGGQVSAQVGHNWIDCCMADSAVASSTSLLAVQGRARVLVMMNIALSWLQAGLSGVYITLGTQPKNSVVCVPTPC